MHLYLKSTDCLEHCGILITRNKGLDNYKDDTSIEDKISLGKFINSKLPLGNMFHYLLMRWETLNKIEQNCKIISIPWQTGMPRASEPSREAWLIDPSENHIKAFPPASELSITLSFRFRRQLPTASCRLCILLKQTLILESALDEPFHRFCLMIHSCQ